MGCMKGYVYVRLNCGLAVKDNIYNRNKNLLMMEGSFTLLVLFCCHCQGHHDRFVLPHAVEEVKPFQYEAYDPDPEGPNLPETSNVLQEGYVCCGFSTMQKEVLVTTIIFTAEEVLCPQCQHMQLCWKKLIGCL